MALQRVAAALITAHRSPPSTVHVHATAILFILQLWQEHCHGVEGHRCGPDDHPARHDLHPQGGGSWADISTQSPVQCVAQKYRCHAQCSWLVVLTVVRVFKAKSASTHALHEVQSLPPLLPTGQGRERAAGPLHRPHPQPGPHGRRHRPPAGAGHYPEPCEGKLCNTLLLGCWA